MQTRMYKKGRLLMDTVIVSSLTLAAWTKLLVVLNEMTWLPS